MRDVRMCARALLRRRLLGTLAVALLVGISGGAVLGAIAGARRTRDAYDRMLQATRAADVDIRSGEGFYEFDAERVGALPHVRYVADINGFGFALPGKDGLPDVDNSIFAAGAADGIHTYRRNRPVKITGRLPNPNRPHEVAFNEILARQLHVRVGDILHTQLFNIAGFGDLDPNAPVEEFLQHFTPFEIKIVGIARIRADLLVNENQDAGGAFVSPAFVKRYRDLSPFNFLQVTLDDDRNLAGFETAMRREFADTSVDFESRNIDRATFNRNVGPYRDALRAFALVAAIAAFLVVVQALARLVELDSDDGRTLFALGATRSHRAAGSTARAIVAIGIGWLLAIGAAIAASALFPIGPARQAEPSHGVHVDPLVVLGGGVVLALLLVVPVGLVAWRAARAHPRFEDEPQVRHQSRVADLIASSGGPVSLLAGVRFALQRDRGRGGSLPFRVFGLVVAVAMTGAVVVFASNLDDLVSQPARFGWTWDVIIDMYDNAVTPGFIAKLKADRQFEGLSEGTRASINVSGHTIPTFGFEALRGHALPPIVEGRWPRSFREIALGTQTMRDLHVQLGGRLVARAPDGTAVRLRVVGRTVLPSLSLNGAYGIGQGAAVRSEALTKLDPEAPASFALADLAPGARLSAVKHRYGEVAGVLGPQRPADIDSYDKVQATPAALAGLLAVLGVGVLAHLLVTSVRDRRREIAVLKTIGFGRRQVAAAVSSQATTVATVALLIGVPLGLVAGAIVWRRFANDLGIGDRTGFPVPAFALVVVVAVLVANVVALIPAVSAARTRPAAVLRAE